MMCWLITSKMYSHAETLPIALNTQSFIVFYLFSLCTYCSTTYRACLVCIWETCFEIKSTTICLVWFFFKRCFEKLFWERVLEKVIDLMCMRERFVWKTCKPNKYWKKILEKFVWFDYFWKLICREFFPKFFEKHKPNKAFIFLFFVFFYFYWIFLIFYVIFLLFRHTKHKYT